MREAGNELSGSSFESARRRSDEIFLLRCHDDSVSICLVCVSRSLWKRILQILAAKIRRPGSVSCL